MQIGHLYGTHNTHTHTHSSTHKHKPALHLRFLWLIHRFRTFLRLSTCFFFWSTKIPTHTNADFYCFASATYDLFTFLCPRSVGGKIFLLVAVVFGANIDLHYFCHRTNTSIHHTAQVHHPQCWPLIMEWQPRTPSENIWCIAPISTANLVLSSVLQYLPKCRYFLWSTKN